MTNKYRLIQMLIVGLTLILVSCGQERVKDNEELVLSEVIYEKGGIYYKGDCANHAKMRYSGESEFYHDNGKLKGFVMIDDGLPTGHWIYWDSTGLKKLDLFFDKGNQVKKEMPEPELNFPWTKNMTKNAVGAILTSIENITTDSLYHGDFPTDVHNTPFVRKNKTDFDIIGYETSDSSPELLKIDFRPINEYKSGPRFTVEMNLITEQAIKVYMSPDA